MASRPPSSILPSDVKRGRRDRIQAALASLQQTLLNLGVDPKALSTQAAVLEHASTLLALKTTPQEVAIAGLGRAKAAEENLPHPRAVLSLSPLSNPLLFFNPHSSPLALQISMKR